MKKILTSQYQLTSKTTPTNTIEIESICSRLTGYSQGKLNESNLAHPYLNIYEQFNHHTEELRLNKSSRIDSVQILRSDLPALDLIPSAANYYTQVAAKTFLLSHNKNLTEALLAALEAEYARGLMDGICAITTTDYKGIGQISKGSERATNRARAGGIKKQENYRIINNTISEKISNLPEKKLWKSLEEAIEALASEVLITTIKEGISPPQRLQSIIKIIKSFIDKNPVAHIALTRKIKK